ncbi:hypothetical protein KO361_04130 [Candidatus Woesearchaeota archaeon]|nr:hypothetical protein [Candidatus Woesearchaeota archaeon]
MEPEQQKTEQNEEQKQPPKKYPSNPEREKKIEQLKILIERHNFLVDQVNLLDKDFEEKEIRIKDFKKITKQDLEEQKQTINQVKELIIKTEKLKKEISKDFKEIVKKPLLDKLDKRIDNTKYEEYIYRDELDRQLKKQKN